MRYVYPPRPVGKIIYNDLPIYETSGSWIVQRKYNGTRSLIFRLSQGQYKFFNRHGREHHNFSPTKSMISCLDSLNYQSDKEYVIDGELMNKVSGKKNFLIFFDVLVVDGKYLFGKPNQMERLNILKNLCDNPIQNTDWGFRLADDVFLADFWENNFLQQFQKVSEIPEIEGLVLRKRFSALDNFGQSEYCTSTQVRCRKPNDKSYNF